MDMKRVTSKQTNKKRTKLKAATSWSFLEHPVKSQSLKNQI